MKHLMFISITALLISCSTDPQDPITTKTTDNGKKTVKKKKSPNSIYIFTDSYGCRWVVINRNLHSRAGTDLEHHPTCDNPNHSKH